MNMISMNKVVSVMLILFFINGLFITVFSSVSASDLIEGSWNVKAPMQQARLVFGLLWWTAKFMLLEVSQME